jgi:hypothetical protein
MITNSIGYNSLKYTAFGIIAIIGAVRICFELMDLLINGKNNEH